MILQLGAFLGEILPDIGLTSDIGKNFITPLLNQIGSVGLNIGKQFATGLVAQQVARLQKNSVADQVKAQLRAAANAVSPTVAPGQKGTYSGGPATGTAFQPATLLPPSTEPPGRILHTNPDFFPRNDTFSLQRRVATGIGAVPIPNAAPVPVTAGIRRVGFLSGAARVGTMIAEELLPRAVTATKAGATIAARRGAQVLEQFNPATPIGRRMLATGAAAVGLETAGQYGLDAILNPSVAGEAIQSNGNPLRIGATMANGTTSVPTGLPARGRYQREANGVLVQWYFFNGQSMVPVSRQFARQCAKKDCIYRLDVFTGRYVKLKSRRMNPANISAFFRAGRRIDAMERICRKVFSEKRRQKSGAVRRKTRRKKK